MFGKIKRIMIYGIAALTMTIGASTQGITITTPIKANAEASSQYDKNNSRKLENTDGNMSKANVPVKSKAMTLKGIIKSLGIKQLEIHLLVDKPKKLLTIYNGNTALKSYHIELGDSGPGDKKTSGDHKTPEGTFYISQKLVLNPSDKYLGTRWMRLSYPNIEDAQRGLDAGLIDKSTYKKIVDAVNNGITPPQNTALGGGVGIHGGSTASLGTNWTFGCVGLTNKDVQDFYDYIKVGTKVIILA